MKLALTLIEDPHADQNARHWASKQRVYFIESGPGGPIKIGTTYDVGGRMRELQIGNPVPLCVCLIIPGDRDVEQTLHQRFAVSRLRGEWFARSPELDGFIRRMRELQLVEAKR